VGGVDAISKKEIGRKKEEKKGKGKKARPQTRKQICPKLGKYGADATLKQPWENTVRTYVCVS